MTAPFVVLTMPRARSYWLSKFLDCPHDPSRHFRDAGDLCGYFNDGACAVDTALGLIWAEHAPRIRRDMRVAVIHRPVPDVVASLEELGEGGPRAEEVIHRMADRLLRIPGAHFTYSQVGTFMGAGMLFTHCHGVPCPEEWWDEMRVRREEADIGAIKRDCVANAAGLARLFGEAVA